MKRGVAARAAVAARPWSTVRRVVVMVSGPPAGFAVAAEHVVAGAEKSIGGWGRWKQGRMSHDAPS